jgi:hypothetical protein
MFLKKTKKVVLFKTKLLLLTIKSRVFLRYSTIRKIFKNIKVKLKSRGVLIVSKTREIVILYKETLLTVVSLLVGYLLFLEPKLFLFISPIFIPFIIMVIVDLLKILFIGMFLTFFVFSILYFSLIEILVVYKPLILRILRIILRIFLILWLILTILSIGPFVWVASA